MKYFRVLGVLALLVFSFYLTDFATNLAINSSSLMETIKKSSEDYYVESVNAYIENNTIIPGIKGKKINEMESFLNMKDFGAFNSNYLIYDLIKPDISLDNNKEKIIISGNKSKRNISILIKNNKEVRKYLNNIEIKYNNLIYNEYLDKKHENINIESNKDNFKNIETILNKERLNKGICILNYSNIEICKEKKYYLVNPNIFFKNNSLVESLGLLSNGSIVLIDDNLSLENFKLFLQRVNNLDLKIVYLSELIEE